MKTVIATDAGARLVGPYSQAIRANGLIFADKSLEQIVKANRQLLEKDFPLTYYSRQLLFSDRARESWVEPDLKHFSKVSFELRSSKKKL